MVRGLGFWFYFRFGCVVVLYYDWQCWRVCGGWFWYNISFRGLCGGYVIVFVVIVVL